MAYESLRQVFYKDNSAHRFARVAELARIRLEAESSFRTGVLGSAGEFFLAVPRELSVLNEHVLRMERKIARQREQLPPIAQWALERRLVVDEVVSTNELEGVYSTRRQINELLRADGPLQSQPHERKRFRELAQLYLSLAGTHASPPSTPEDIRALYDNIMQDEPLDEGQRPDGILFRRDQVEIVGAGGKVVHQGLHPESAIRSTLESMLALCASPDIPETYSAILGHFLFEYAHPFYDGNGRTGRFLLALHLSQPLSVLTSLSLSRVIADNRGAYYRSFREAEHPQNHGELTSFVLNMLGNVHQAQRELDARLAVDQARIDQARERLRAVQSRERLSDSNANLIYMLAQLDLFAAFPEASLGDVARQLGLSRQQARRRTVELEGRGLIVSVGKRPLSFVLSEALRDELGLAEA